MPGDSQQINFEVANVYLNLAAGLGSIGMKQDPMSFGDLADFLDGLNRPHLVVGVQYGDKNGVFAIFITSSLIIFLNYRYQCSAAFSFNACRTLAGVMGSSLILTPMAL